MSYAGMLDSFMQAVLEGDSRDAEKLVRARDDFPASRQIGIYREGYILRIREAVRNTYPALFHYLGEDAFYQLADGFMQHPSRSFNIDMYAMTFGAYAAHHTDDIIANDLALLEHSIAWVHMAGESPALTPEWAAAQSPESLGGVGFSLREASRLVKLHYEVNHYLNALREGENPPAPTANINYLLVYRHRHQVLRLDLAEGEYALLAQFNGKTPLAETLESPEFAPYCQQALQEGELMRWFARWIENGCLRQL